MNTVISTLFSGLTLGGLYALVGLGLVLIYRATGVFNFAHGQLMLFAAYLVGYWTSNGWGNAAAIFASLAVVAVIGMGSHLAFLRRTIGRPEFMAVIAALGLATVLDGVMGIAFGSTQYTLHFPGTGDGTVDILGSTMSGRSIVIFVFSVVLIAVVAAVLRFTTVGVRLRAAGQAPLLTSQAGINISRYYLVAWAIGAALAGVAGVVYGSVYVANPAMVAIVFSTLPAIFLGGLDSVPGALVGGLTIGILQNFAAVYLGGEVSVLVVYLILIGVLVVRPHGLFGTPEIVKV